MFDTEREPQILIAAKWSLESGKVDGVVIQRDLMVPFERVDHSKKFHAGWDCTDRLKRRGGLKVRTHSVHGSRSPTGCHRFFHGH